MEDLKIGLILGTHPFDTIHMYPMFWQMDGIRIYPQLTNNFLYDFGGNNDEYDGYVFYNMDMTEPSPEDTFGDSPVKAADTFFRIGEDGKGLVILHHALLAYPESRQWSDVIGIQNRGFDYFVGVDVDVHVTDPAHPITAGIRDWKVTDETYLMDTADESCHILLETDCDKSSRTLAWTRKYKNSNVFCLALGHDKIPFENANFREVLKRGILWSCNQLGFGGEGYRREDTGEYY